MTREETLKLLMGIQTAFPNFKIEDKRIALDTWHELLGEYSYQSAYNAVMAFIRTDTKGFAPSIGQIIGWIERIERPTENEMTAIEAKDLIMRAARDLDPFEPEKKFNALPPICQRLVGSAARLKELAYEEDPAALLSWQARFQTSYAEAKQQERDLRQLPSSVRARIETNRTDRYSAPKIERKADPVIEENPLTFADMPESAMERMDDLIAGLSEALAPKEGGMPISHD